MSGGDGFGAIKLLMGFPQEAVVPQSLLRVGDRVRCWVVTDATVTQNDGRGPVVVTATDEHRCISLVERPEASE